MSNNPNRNPNRLVNETSPYLLQHAYNPVDWHPWNDDALAAARAENKPILLSVGYSACHWCHVMERESFENLEIADAMNRDFICIKVDREERPDIDAIYMNCVQLMTGQGGWPMTVFLTPEGKPFYGGTYYPPVDRYGRPGFPRILAAVARAWTTERAEIESQSLEIVAQLNGAADLFSDGTQRDTLLTSQILDSALAALTPQFDRNNGGFGSAPKFPQPANLDLLLRLHKRFHRAAPLEMVELTLQKMACGGIYDQLGGGFHRYSTDAIWLAPHFEKMLYDNAQLALTYCRAFQITGKQLYRDIAEETLDYVLREMTDADTGAFYSAQDADSEGEEGRYFVWSLKEITEALGVEIAAAFASFYDVTAPGNWEGKSILRVVRDVKEVASAEGLTTQETAEIIDSARAALLARRELRVKPGLDDKSLTAWNSLMLAAFAGCGAAFNRADYIEAARRNAEFISTQMSNEKDGSIRLYRTYRCQVAKLNGYLEDYAFYANALIELYQATTDRKWLVLAGRIAKSMIAFFQDPDDGGFYATSTDHEQLIQRMKDWDDNATPSGNSVALETLLKLSAYQEDSVGREDVGKFLRNSARIIEKHPYGFARLLGVLDLYLDAPFEVAIIGFPGAEDTTALLRTVNAAYLPNMIVATASPDETTQDLPMLQGRTAIDGFATAYVCRNGVCSLPIINPAELEKALSL